VMEHHRAVSILTRNGVRINVIAHSSGLDDPSLVIGAASQSTAKRPDIRTLIENPIVQRGRMRKPRIDLQKRVDDANPVHHLAVAQVFGQEDGAARLFGHTQYQ